MTTYTSSSIASYTEIDPKEITTLVIDGFDIPLDPNEINIGSLRAITSNNGLTLYYGHASGIDGDENGVFYSFDQANGFSDVIVANTQRNLNQSKPIIEAGDNNFLVYWESTTSNNEYFYQIISDTGELLGSNVNLNSQIEAVEHIGGDQFIFFDHTTYGYFYTLEVDSTGITRSQTSDTKSSSTGTKHFFDSIKTSNDTVAVTYTSYGYNSNDVFFVEYDIETKSFSEEKLATFSTSLSQKFSHFYELNSTSILLFWIDDDNGKHLLKMRLFDENLSPKSLDIDLGIRLPNAVNSPKDYYAITPYGDDKVILVYRNGEDSGTLYSSAFDKNGKVIAAPQKLDNEPIHSTLPISLYESEGIPYIMYFDSSGQMKIMRLDFNSAPTGDLVITGSTAEDATLTVQSSISDADGLNAFSYSWFRDNELIDGANTASLTLGDDDAGTAITAQIVYLDGNGVTETVLTSATSVIENVNDYPEGEPFFSGDLKQGTPITIDTSAITDADGVGAFSFSWARTSDNINFEVIQTGTSATYTPDQADVGSDIHVEVSYEDGFGTIETIPLSSGLYYSHAVHNVNDQVQGHISLSGLLSEDSVLSSDVSDLTDLDGIGDFSYQWYANGQALQNATSSNYTLTQAEVGKQISVGVSFVDGFGATETVLSSATGVIENVNDPVDGDLIVTGDFMQSDTLSINSDDLTDEDGLGSFQYQWFRNGAEITGAQDATYKLTQNDVGKYITAGVSYVDPYGNHENVISNNANPAVQNKNDSPIGIPEITGFAKVGNTLSVDTSALSDLDGLGQFAFQWFSGAEAIDGAVYHDYTLERGSVGEEISVVVSYIDGFGQAESIQSITTAPVVSSDHQISLAIKNRDGNTIDGFEVLGVAQAGNEEFYFEFDKTQDDSFEVNLMVNPTALSDSFRFQIEDQNTLSDFEFGSTFLDWNPMTNPATITAITNSTVTANGLTTTNQLLPNTEYELANFTSIGGDLNLELTQARLNDDVKNTVSLAGNIETTGASGVAEFTFASSSDVLISTQESYENIYPHDDVNERDALQLMKMLIPNSTETITQADLIASDFNRDGKVDTMDVKAILEYSLGLAGSKEAEWALVQMDELVDNTTSNVDYDLDITLSNLTSDISVDATAILIGDVNNSFV